MVMVNIRIQLYYFQYPRLYIQDLLRSLKVKTGSPFPAYKIDLSLTYLKGLYEDIFPQKKHGGYLATRSGETDLNKVRGETYNVKDSFTLTKDIPLPERSIIRNLFEGAENRNHLPSFVELISTRVSLSKTAIQNRIRVGRYMIKCGRIDNLILLYRKKGVSHSKVLKEIRKIDKMTICGKKLIKIKPNS